MKTAYTTKEYTYRVHEFLIPSWPPQSPILITYSWGRKETDTTEQLNWTEQMQSLNQMISLS